MARGSSRPAGSFRAPGVSSGPPASWGGLAGNATAGSLSIPVGAGVASLGGAGLSLSASTIPASATGIVSQLATGLGGAVTYSKVAGAANVSVAAGGAVSITTALAAGATNTFAARAVNAAGDAVEKSFTLTGASADTATPSPGPGAADFSSAINSGLIAAIAA